MSHEERRLTHGTENDVAAVWSPDGKSRKGRGFVMRANGSGMKAVTRTTLWDSAPDWGAAG